VVKKITNGVEPYEGLGSCRFSTIVGHQIFAHFIDFRGLADEYMKEKESITLKLKKSNLYPIGSIA